MKPCQIVSQSFQRQRYRREESNRPSFRSCHDEKRRHFGDFPLLLLFRIYGALTRNGLSVSRVRSSPDRFFTQSGGLPDQVFIESSVDSNRISHISLHDLRFFDIYFYIVDVCFDERHFKFVRDFKFKMRPGTVWIGNTCSCELSASAHPSPR